MSAQRIRPLIGISFASVLLVGCSSVPDWVPFSSWFNSESSTAVAAPETRPAGAVPVEEFEPAQEVASGAFIGQEGHISRGRVRIVAKEGRMHLRFLNDFILDDACDGRVILGNRGIRAEAEVAPLQADAGPQSYVVPGGLDVNNYQQVWITCGGEPRAKAELVFL